MLRGRRAPESAPGACRHMNAEGAGRGRPRSHLWSHSPPSSTGRSHSPREVVNVTDRPTHREDGHVTTSSRLRCHIGQALQAPRLLRLRVHRAVDHVTDQDEDQRHDMRAAVGSYCRQPGNRTRGEPAPQLGLVHSVSVAKTLIGSIPLERAGVIEAARLLFANGACRYTSIRDNSNRSSCGLDDGTVRLMLELAILGFLAERP